jgi:hypothetical protein
VIVTARLREEDAQSVPISLSVVDGDTLDETFTNNTLQIAQLVPPLNYVSPNPRNTAFTIRGLGSSVVAVSQANDGLEPGVGFYVDQVYHARPATAAFDYLDLDRAEVLRGPQGTPQRGAHRQPARPIADHAQRDAACATDGRPQLFYDRLLHAGALWRGADIEDTRATVPGAGFGPKLRAP